MKRQTEDVGGGGRAGWGSWLESQRESPVSRRILHQFPTRQNGKKGNYAHLDRVQTPPGTSRLSVDDDPNMFFAR